MDTSTRTALFAFLANLTHAQEDALMDVLASHVENVETDVEDDRPVEHAFIVALSEYITSHVATR
jgi:hypothetical protein